ncbi:hypothetical protein [Peribacillus sp. SI8-4]|uniref:hypothetical protein n=1 Tax=Peribacillus sp. SI8-4 TaxID=3048009 RepID=UPI002555732B|nr:hypothetical protein [Peribacillus sp. SI8-4]
MNERQDHELTIIDFMKTGHHTCFVQVSGFDAEYKKKFEGEVKFVGDVPYGDLIHSQRSHVSSSCREFIREDLIYRHKGRQFE